MPPSRIVWLLPFAMAFCIYMPLHETQRDLFENIMGLTLTATTLLFANLYFRRVQARFIGQGALIGIAWMAISIAIDLPMFSWGPMARPLTEYLKDIGLAYLMIPAITIGCGFLLAGRRPGG